MISTTVAPARFGRQTRRELAAADRRSAHLAELHHIAALAAAARRLVESGWVRGAWFALPDGRLVGGPGIAATATRPVAGACLVGAIVHAGGGAGTQLVRRTIELAWHTLHGDTREPVRWCPAPHDRAAHVRDLTRWNDRPGRTAGEVAALLDGTGVAAGRLREASL